MTTRNWVNNGGTALSAANLNSLEADLDKALAVPDAALAQRLVAGASKTALDAAYTPRWKANTAYTLGQQVVLPDNQIGAAKSAFTSGASYDSSKWTLLGTVETVNAATDKAEVITRTNYATNPSVETNTTGYSMQNGGGATTTAVWASGAPGAGSSSYRATVTTPPTGAGFGPQIKTATGAMPGIATDVVSGGIWVYVSVACSMYLSMVVYTGTTYGAGKNGPTIAVPANTWTLLKYEGMQATVSFDCIRFWPQVVSTDVSKFVAGATLAVDAMLVEKASTLGAYFDGATPTVGTTTTRWAGTAHASVSYQLDNATLVRRTASGTLEVATPINSGDAATKGYVDSKAVSINVKSAPYNAKGDGVADDGDAIRAAMAALTSAGGGTLYFPPGNFWWSTYVPLASNILITGPGTIIKKPGAGDVNYAMFASQSNGLKGYASGAVNVRVAGMSFKGNFDGGGACAFALHHADNIVVEDCTFTEMQEAGHVFDLNGCSNITIRNCTFYGFKNIGGGYDKSEAIQLDISAAGSASSPDTAGSWDGLPTKNVTVEGCKFLPYTKGATTYPAPNPLGAHALRENAWHENIRFVGNYIKDPSVDAGASSLPGSIHFVCSRNIVISGNVWEASTAYVTRLIGLYSIDKGEAATSNNESGASNPIVTITPMPINNVKITDNVFKGFSATLGASAHMIQAISKTDNNAPVTAKDIVFRGNTITVNGGTAALTAVDLTYVDGMTVVDNTFTGPVRMVGAANCSSIRVAKNYSSGARADAINAVSMTNLSIEGNSFKSPAASAVYVGISTNVDISGNLVDTPGTGSRVLGVSGVAKFSVNGNILTATGYTVGIEVYGTSSYGGVRGNTVTGGTTPVVTAGTGVTATDNTLAP